MAADFGKLLGKIEDENTTLREAQVRLNKAYVKLDSKLTRLGARTRVEPYEVDKKSEAVIGYRRFETGYAITTMRVPRSFRALTMSGRRPRILPVRYDASRKAASETVPELITGRQVLMYFL